MTTDNAQRILLIEDDLDLAEAMVDYLELQDCEVTLAIDGISAERIRRTGDFDVWIVDIGLPRRCRLETVAALRERGFSSPAIFVTAQDTTEDKLQAFANGADDYLVKPVVLPELMARIQAIIKRGQQSAQSSSRLSLATPYR